jgi:hypothetical protein
MFFENMFSNPHPVAQKVALPESVPFVKIGAGDSLSSV